MSHRFSVLCLKQAHENLITFQEQDFPCVSMSRIFRAFPFVSKPCWTGSIRLWAFLGSTGGWENKVPGDYFLWQGKEWVLVTSTASD